MVRVWVAGKTVWSHCYTWAIFERFRDEELIIKRYINLSVYFTLPGKCNTRPAIISVQNSIAEHQSQSSDTLVLDQKLCWWQIMWCWWSSGVEHAASFIAFVG